MSSRDNYQQRSGGGGGGGDSRSYQQRGPPQHYDDRRSGDGGGGGRDDRDRNSGNSYGGGGGGYRGGDRNSGGGGGGDRNSYGGGGGDRNSYGGGGGGGYRDGGGGGGGYGGGRGGGGGGGYRGGGGGGRGDFRGGRGDFRGGRGGGGGARDNYSNGGGGGQYDNRKRHNDDNYGEPQAKFYKDEKAVPAPLDFEVEGTIDGKPTKTNYKNIKQGSVTALTRLTIQGKIETAEPFTNEMAMFLGQLSAFYKQASIRQSICFGTNKPEALKSLKSITMALLSTCNLLQIDADQLNFLALPALARVPEMQLTCFPGQKCQAKLEIATMGSKLLLDWLHGRSPAKKGVKKLTLQSNLDFAKEFLVALRMDNTDAQFFIRIICKENPLPFTEFSNSTGEKTQFWLKKEGNNQVLIAKCPVGKEAEKAPEFAPLGKEIAQIVFTNEQTTPPPQL